MTSLPSISAMVCGAAAPRVSAPAPVFVRLTPSPIANGERSTPHPSATSATTDAFASSRHSVDTNVTAPVATSVPPDHRKRRIPFGVFSNPAPRRSVPPSRSRNSW